MATVKAIDEPRYVLELSADEYGVIMALLYRCSGGSNKLYSTAMAEGFEHTWEAATTVRVTKK